MVGHRIGICDPDPLCLARFSRFVTHYYQCPAMGKDPWAYLDFVVALLAQGHWDVLFPSHEQAFLFSRERARIPRGVGLAVSDFQSFLKVQGKAALVRTLASLSIPQPVSRVIQARGRFAGGVRFPAYLKADYATASTAVWRIANAAELDAKLSELASYQEFVIQEAVAGTLERVQAVFDKGRLIAIHGYRQTAAGIGGGDIAKLGVSRPDVRRYVECLGGALQWHGALSLDYILREDSTPMFIDVNPRLVEPMNAVFSGVNLAGMLLRVSTGEHSANVECGATAVRTHMLLMALLTAGSRRGRRIDLLVELVRAVLGRGLYAGSREELLPIRIDFKSLFPLMYTLARLLCNPGSAKTLSGGAIDSYSLSPAAARQIADLGGQ